jgi:F-type H+-transporting ATPase subunit b
MVRAEHEPGHEGGEHPAEHAGAEHAGGEHGGAHEASIDPGKLAFQLINFAVLAGILGWFGGRAINKALLERHNQLKADLVAASEARTAAEKRAAEQEKRLASLETEIAGIRAGIKDEAEAEKQRLIAAAEERAKRIGDETKFLLDQQVKEAEATLKREVAEAAVKIAEALVTKSLTGADQQRLVDTFVVDATKVSPPGRSA